MDFINPFNEATKEYAGKDVTVHIKVYDDRSFDWTCIGRPVDDLIREKIKLEKGSGKPNTEKVGKITMDQIKEIVEIKKGELNAIDEAGACKQIAGTARSMGVEVVE